MKGKYKIGQQLPPESRIILAKKILQRNSENALKTIKTMGFEITSDGLKMVEDPVW